ncbi:MAG: DUF3857 domain-containing protein [Planctomycetes bacterium]|nr:DUF3857 domain-containing protein [Planctomycetota bacterium]
MARVVYCLCALAVHGGIVAAPALAQELWDERYVAGDPNGSFEVHAARLLAGRYPPIEGLSVDASNEAWQDAEIRFCAGLIEEIGDARLGSDLLARFLATPRGPLVDSHARLLLGDYQWRTGRSEEARKTWAPLGVIDRWLLIGPFDNERGSGLARRDPPESEFVADARYAGKRNEVAWRAVQGARGDGTMLLEEMLRPNEEAQAYLATHISSAREQVVALRIGTAGSYALWLNGKEIARRDVERPLAFDQESVAVRLAAGWNRLLLKSAHTKGTWALRVRVTDAAGHAATGIDFAAEMPKEAALAPAAQQDNLPPVAGGAAEILAGAAPGAIAQRLLGWILQHRSAHDVHEHPHREQYLLALAAEPESAITHYLIADSYRREVTHSAEREENPWRHAMEAALLANPNFHRVRIELAEYYIERFGNLRRADALLAPVLAAAPVPTRALALAAQVLAQRIGGEAAAVYRSELESRMAAELYLDFRLDRARASFERGRRTQAKKLLEDALQFDATKAAVRALLVDFALAEGDEAGAAKQHAALVAAFPDRVEPLVDYSDFESGRENWEQALEEIESALAIAPEDERLRERRGKLLWKLDRRDAAVAEFELALRLEPNQPRLREYVEFLSNRDSHLEEEFRVPPEPLIAAALERREESNDPARILLDNQAVEIHLDGTTTRFHQILVKVTNDDGIRQYNNYSVPYAYGEQWVKVIKARVHHPDGGYEDAKIQNLEPRRREGEYPLWSSARVDVPPLERGFVVEVEYRLEDLRQSFFGDYFGDEVYFADTRPRDRTIYTIVAPPEKKLYYNQVGLPVTPTSPEVRAEPSRRIWRWDLANAGKIDPEPSMPPLEEVVPRVQVSTFQDWDAFASWYHHLIRKQFESSPEIRAKVAELTTGMQSRADKIRAIYNFVVTDVRYIAWEFGVHGFKPYNAATVFTRRHGDCKDKATLICTMLEEVDIEAHPVLIYGADLRGKEDFTLPLVGHFNHCIAYVPDRGDGKGLFLDGTAEHHSMDQLPMMDRGAKVLIVEEDGGKIRDVPWNSPDELAVDERVKVRVGGDGSAVVQQENRLSGDYAVWTRSRFEIEAERAAQIERDLGRVFPGTRVEEVEMSPLDDLNTPVSMRIKLRVPEYLDDSGEGVKLPPLRDFFGGGESLRSAASRAERQFDLLLGNPSQTELLVEIELPAGYEVGYLPDSFDLEIPHAQFQFKAEVCNGRITMRRFLNVRSPRVAAAEYPEFKSFVDRVEKFREERVILKKVGGAE